MKKRTYWDTFEGAYQMGPQRHRNYLLELLKDREVKSILDVGCGTGPLYELLDWEVKYKGTDYSWAMIKAAKKIFPDADFEVQDARHMKEQDSSWDAVVMMHVLDHLDKYDEAIKEAARITKKYVVIVLWRSFVAEGTNLNPRNMYGKKEGEEPWEDTYLHEYSREILENEFTKNNLSIHHIAEGEKVSDPGRYNFLWLLKKM
jgi:ubiquinone/menaquinone biosynthesis C-methylase UbiE